MNGAEKFQIFFEKLPVSPPTEIRLWQAALAEATERFPGDGIADLAILAGQLLARILAAELVGPDVDRAAGRERLQRWNITVRQGVSSC